jgi:hypothetical protein
MEVQFWPSARAAVAQDLLSLFASNMQTQQVGVDLLVSGEHHYPVRGILNAQGVGHWYQPWAASTFIEVRVKVIHLPRAAATVASIGPPRPSPAPSPTLPLTPRGLGGGW